MYIFVFNLYYNLGHFYLLLMRFLDIIFAFHLLMLNSERGQVEIQPRKNCGAG